MKRLALLLALFAFAAPAFAEDAAPAPDPVPDAAAAPAAEAPMWYAGHAQEKFLSKADAMIENAMAGYNKEDWKTFFADYGKQMEAVATEQTFQTMVLGMFKKDAGAYKGKKLLEERCSFNDTAPLLMFEGEFENGKRLLAVNFTKEGDLFKVMQIQIQPLP